MPAKRTVDLKGRVTQQLVDAFYEAAVLLKHKVEHDNCIWSSNYLREYVRVHYLLKFGNELSPVIMDEVIAQHPELGAWIKLKAHKPADHDYIWTIGKHLVPTTTRKKLM
jgi:hypothetical protein